jgi:hypothetical protein
MLAAVVPLPPRSLSLSPDGCSVVNGVGNFQHDCGAALLVVS